MGNVGSSGGGGGSGRRRNQNHHHHFQQHPGPSILPPPPPTPQPPTPPPEVSAGNRYVFAAATHYPQYPNPNSPQYYQYVGYYPPPPPMPAQLPAPFDHHHRSGDHPVYPQSWANAPRYACGAAPPSPTPFVEHQKAITIRNDVNLKKETLRIEPDEENPGRYLVAFSFDATVAGSIKVIFFAKEGFNCDLMPMKEALLAPVTVSFKDGLGQKFKQPPGTGIDFSLFEEADLIKDGETEIYPLAVKAEALPVDKQGSMGNQGMVALNSQITQAVFEKKENGEYQIRVVKQILWVNGTRYELQEIYGIGNTCDGDFDDNDPGKECVICLTEPRDTTVLPCRHMCMCSGCAKLLRYQTNRCPICRQPVERLLEIKVNNRCADEHQEPSTQHTVVETSGQTPMLKTLP